MSFDQNPPPSVVQEKFFQSSGTVVFLRVHSFHLFCFGNLSAIKLAVCILKARLGGEIRLELVRPREGSIPKIKLCDNMAPRLTGSGFFLRGRMCITRPPGLRQSFFATETFQ